MSVSVEFNPAFNIGFAIVPAKRLILPLESIRIASAPPSTNPIVSANGK